MNGVAAACTPGNIKHGCLSFLIGSSDGVIATFSDNLNNEIYIHLVILLVEILHVTPMPIVSFDAAAR